MDRRLRLGLGVIVLGLVTACGPSADEQPGGEQAEAAPDAPPAVDAGSFSGTFMGNDRPARLNHIQVQTMDDWTEPAWTILLSENKPEPNRPWSSGCQYGDFGDALIVTLTETGRIIKTIICHQEFGQGFSASGVLEAEPFAIENGVLSAHVATREDMDQGGDRYSVDLKLEVTLP